MFCWRARAAFVLSLVVLWPGQSFSAELQAETTRAWETYIDLRSEQPGQTEAAHKMFKDASGLDVIDGARMTTHMYFHSGRFYLFQGINLPIDGDVRSPDAIRFALSFTWAGDLAN